MDNTARKIETFARPTLNRTLAYRPHIRWIFNGSMVLSGVFAVTAIAWLAASNVLSQRVTGLFGFAFFTVAALMIWLHARRVVRPLMITKVFVNPDHLRVTRDDRDVTLRYTDVEKVNTSHIPYLGGWFSLQMKTGEKHFFTVVLERSEYILDGLAAIQPELVNNDRVMSYRRTAVYCDHSWARAYERLNNRTALAAKYLLAPAVLATLAYFPALLAGRLTGVSFAMGLTSLLAMIVCNFAVSQFAQTFAELWLVAPTHRRMKENPQAVRRDAVVEAKAQTAAHIMYGLFSLAWFVAGVAWIWTR